MTYILIFMIYGGQGVSSGSVEFNSLKACQTAAQTLKDSTDRAFESYHRSGIFCTEKGKR